MLFFFLLHFFSDGASWLHAHERWDCASRFGAHNGRMEYASVSIEDFSAPTRRLLRTVIEKSQRNPKAGAFVVSFGEGRYRTVKFSGSAEGSDTVEKGRGALYRDILKRLEVVQLETLTVVQLFLVEREARDLFQLIDDPQIDEWANLRLALYRDFDLHIPLEIYILPGHQVWHEQNLRAETPPFPQVSLHRFTYSPLFFDE